MNEALDATGFDNVMAIIDISGNDDEAAECLELDKRYSDQTILIPCILQMDL